MDIRLITPLLEVNPCLANNGVLINVPLLCYPLIDSELNYLNKYAYFVCDNGFISITRKMEMGTFRISDRYLLNRRIGNSYDDDAEITYHRKSFTILVCSPHSLKFDLKTCAIPYSNFYRTVDYLKNYRKFKKPYYDIGGLYPWVENEGAKTLDFYVPYRRKSLKR